MLGAFTRGWAVSSFKLAAGYPNAVANYSFAVLPTTITIKAGSTNPRFNSPVGAAFPPGSSVPHLLLKEFESQCFRIGLPVAFNVKRGGNANGAILHGISQSRTQALECGSDRLSCWTWELAHHGAVTLPSVASPTSSTTSARMSPTGIYGRWRRSARAMKGYLGELSLGGQGTGSKRKSLPRLSLCAASQCRAS